MDRRTAVKTLGIGGLASGGLIFGFGKAFAKDVPAKNPTIPAPAATQLVPAKPSDPLSKALKYVTDVAAMPPDIKSVYEKKAKDKNLIAKNLPMDCKNCSLYLGGDAAVGGCSVMRGKSVLATGWCTGWGPKA